jgi:hypothetical protein
MPLKVNPSLTNEEAEALASAFLAFDIDNDKKPNRVSLMSS